MCSNEHCRLLWEQAGTSLIKNLYHVRNVKPFLCSWLPQVALLLSFLAHIVPVTSTVAHSTEYDRRICTGSELTIFSYCLTSVLYHLILPRSFRPEIFSLFKYSILSQSTPIDINAEALGGSSAIKAGVVFVVHQKVAAKTPWRYQVLS